MSNYYCITFDMRYHREVDKIKIDYACFPVSKVGEAMGLATFKSSVAKDTFLSDFKIEKKIEGFVKFFKKKDQIHFSFAIDGYGNLDDVAKANLPIIEKYIRSKIPFRLRYKKALKERIQRILNDL